MYGKSILCPTSSKHLLVALHNNSYLPFSGMEKYAWSPWQAVMLHVPLAFNAMSARRVALMTAAA